MLNILHISCYGKVYSSAVSSLLKTIIEEFINSACLYYIENYSIWSGLCNFADIFHEQTAALHTKES